VTDAAPANDLPETVEAATKAAVFNAAERLFALHGFQNVSVRDITAEAGVNLASVNYHFGSKDALLFEIFRRRTGELNRGQFIIRSRSEGTAEMRDALTNDVSHLARFADALLKVCPDLPRETVYWRLHFCLGMVHNNRFAEFDRLHVLSDGATREGDTEALLKRMVDFAEAGFLA
jgi:AcrR family transcriptional regulator